MAIFVGTEGREENWGEDYTLEKLMEYLDDSYVIYRNRPVGGSQFDLCVLVPHTGILLIEVKGWRPETVLRVENGDKIIINVKNKITGEMEEKSSNPTDQVRGYVHKMEEKILTQLGKKPVVYYMVCLPQISRERFIETGIDKVCEEETTLLLEDLESEKSFHQKFSRNIANKKGRLKYRAAFDNNLFREIREMFEYNITVEHMYTEENNCTISEDGAVYEAHVDYKSSSASEMSVSDGKSGIRYSLLISGRYAEEKTPAELGSLCRQGISVRLILQEEKRKQYDSLVKKYGKCGLFLFLAAEKSVPDTYIADGRADSMVLNLLKKSVRAFNMEQYMVEHADADGNMMVTAGAGTGKTKVMIDRVMFLLSTVPGLSLKDIGMVTFTREAARNMRNKITERIAGYCKATGMEKYMDWLEETGSMQISTIDSFFKTIIQSRSFELGYSADLNVRGLRYEQNQILRDVMDEMFGGIQGDNFLASIGLPLHAYHNVVLKCWEKLSSKGYYFHDIEKMDFGDASDKDDRIINQNLRKILLEAERRYQETRKKLSAISLQDYNEEISRLVDADAGIEENTLRYLFVDEFQDTDNSQIRTIAWLQRKCRCSLFVVGDIKQSIYRFRGAEESAFDQLQSVLKSENGISVKQYELLRNYRTLPGILKDFNRLFGRLGKKDYLVWQKDVEHDPMKAKKGIFSFLKVNAARKNKNAVKKAVVELLHDLAKKQNEDSGAVTCILTRTNYEVADVASWCREAHIPCIAVVQGGFFASESVRDMFYMLHGILYHHDIRAMYNYLMTGYGEDIPDLAYIEKYAGDTEKVYQYLSRCMGDSFSRLLVDARNKPFFQFVREAVTELNPVHGFGRRRKYQLMQMNYKDEELEKQLYLDMESYRLNLNKLIQIFQTSFASEFVSVLSVYDYLKLQMNTNRKEDLLYPDNKDGRHKAYITAMTVHQSKGLEFDTVIMPFTGQLFFKDTDNMLESGFYGDNSRVDILVQENPLRFGWQLLYKGEAYHNSFYSTYLEEENQAKVREESRLLYVAMTRAKNALYCVVPEMEDANTWAELLNTDGFQKEKQDRDEEE